MSAPDFEELRETILTLTGLTQQLCEVLETERAALIARDQASLKDALEAKKTLCTETEGVMARLGDTPLAEQIAAYGAEASAELETLHSSLRLATERAQECNAVNGKIVMRSQQSVRELIHLVSGMDTELLYGEQGQTTAKAQGTAIARA